MSGRGDSSGGGTRCEGSELKEENEEWKLERSRYHRPRVNGGEPPEGQRY